MSSPAAAAAAAAETEQIVEVDTATPGESDYDSGLPSDTTSIASSVYNFTYDNGRRYTQWGRYLQRMSPPPPRNLSLPSNSLAIANDETEQDRLDIGHQ